MTTWRCPLCAFTTTAADVLPGVVKHATAEHPAYLPERATIADMLDLLPKLIREAVVTVDAPNPDGPAVKVSLAKAGPPVFRESRLLRAANPASESSLFADLLVCSRIIWEAFDAQTKTMHPQPVGDLSWAAELAWLHNAWPDAQAWLDPVDFAWIESEVRHIVGVFAAFAKLRARPRYRCPDCREQMHLSDGDWLTCGAGHQHPGPRRLEREWRRKAPMPTRELCEALRVPDSTLRKWRERGKLRPTREEGRVCWWLPWDVIALRYPDIVTAIDERDQGAA